MDRILKVQLELKEKISKGLINLNKTPKARKTEHYLLARLELLQGIWEEFRTNHKILLQSDEDEKLKNYFKEEIEEIVEEKYIEYKCALKEALSKLDTKVQTTTAATQNLQSTEVKLPRIVLPTFCGNYTDWPTFHDLFESLIHKNTTLPDVQKLQYLKGHLSGEAERLLRNISITSANYESCWLRLKNRYNNKQYISNCIMSKLFNQRSLTSESASGIKQLLDTTCDCLGALANLDIDVTSWDVLIIYLINQKLDNESKKLWEQVVSNDCNSLPTLTEFNKFLETRFRTLENLNLKDKKELFSKKEKDRIDKPKVYRVSKLYCVFCKEEHLLHQCKQFANENIENRRTFIEKQRLCFNCFGSNHTAKICQRQTRCKRCGRRHHSLLHSDNFAADSTESRSNETSPAVQTGDNSISTLFTNKSVIKPSVFVLLATALVKIQNKNKYGTLRALLDQGSEASFITENVVQMLKLRKIPVKGTVQGLGGSKLNVNIKYMVQFKMESIYSSFSVVVQAYVLSNLSSTLPSHHVEIHDWPELAEIQLADPEFGIPRKIDLLLGADLYGQILSHGLIRNPADTLTAQKTTLGWILSGRVESNSSCSRNIISMHLQRNDITNEILRRFWELENDKPQEFLSDEDLKCETYYKTTTTRDDSGRYIVRLPFRDDNPICQYGGHKAVATRRLLALERRLNRDSNYKEEYCKAMRDYINSNHMRLISNKEEANKENCIYLPHHAVFRDDKATTKIRIVFDASCKGENGQSLNDDLLVGPRLQPELRHLIMKWRTYPICFTADIKKMYRQVLLHRDDLKYQRLMWRESPIKEIEEYEMLRVTFGVSSAPYLAVKTLHQVAKDEGKLYPLAAEKIISEFYVDDFMSGCYDETTAIEICHQVIDILKRGGFELQKWASNSRKLMDTLNGEQNIEKRLQLKNDEIVKILGLSWDVESDTFKFIVTLHPVKEPITKRVILSDIARLFDPLGWLSPVIIKAKIFMQKLWLSGISWDEDAPRNLAEEWLKYRLELTLLNQMVIPRWLGLRQDSTDVELHGFCDASNDAYAAVVYLRLKHSNGPIGVNMIGSRTKVAPIKQVSIPRLELCGAVLLTRLMLEISTVMNISKTQLYAWCDSTVVLAWLTGHPNRWKTFVANRVSEILTVLDVEQWAHVESSQNPADCASRGLRPQELLHHELWLHGPEWLRKSEYPRAKEHDSETNLERKFNCMTVGMDSSEEWHVWNKYSSLSRLLKTIAYCKRFINKIRLEKRGLPTHLTAEELENALDLCVLHFQRISFPEEISLLTSGKCVFKKSRLLSLCPFVDDKGIVRVRGRIQMSQELYNTKHPIILSADTYLSRLIVLDAHEKTLHGGPQSTLNYIRSKFWIVNGKNLVRKILRGCVKCTRYSTKNTHPFMGILPSARVNISRPFSRSGVDYAGPINIRMSKGRGAKCYKGYICLFICMATRAIHLEAVSDLTSDGFMAAFKRFVGRRGHCQEIWSDNGSNFIGASRELIQLFKAENKSVLEEVARCLACNGTSWHFIPPHAPNFGGLWEAGVRSSKFHLKRLLDGTTLTYEELSTVLIQIEACLNSRPMSALPSSLEGPSPLTPAHFLVGEPLLAPPDRDYTQFNISTLRRWQLSQRLVQDFWKRWSKEYLTTLNQRYKWTKFTVEPNVGDLVLIKEDDLPPSKWLYGIIVKKYVGPDNVTRVVKLRYKNGEIKRPVSKLCILPITN